MNKKYKIGLFTAEIISPVNYEESEKYLMFSYDGTPTDYKIFVNFSDNLPDSITDPSYETSERIYLAKNEDFCCYFKSHENNSGFYAYRNVEGSNVNIFIDEKYRNMLRTDVIFSLAGIEELVIKNNGCVLHSSYIVKNNEAILFTGPCSIGKSTQAKLWEKYADAIIVNGDKALIIKKDNRLYAAGLPFSGSSKDCKNITVPLKAIVCLGKSTENKIYTLASPQSFYSVYKNCYPVPFSDKLTNCLIDIVSEISEAVPVFEYYCLPDESAVRFLERKFNEL